MPLHLTHLKKLLFLFSLITIIACSSDDDNPPQERTISTSDFSITMDENPENGQVIGFITGETNEGSVSFSIIEQFPENAFSIDSLTGELKVADANLFNFEIYSTITGVVKVAQETLFEIATVTINLNDVEEDRPYEGDVILTTQDEVNTFGKTAYTRINGKLEIGAYSNYDDIEDLTPLLNIEKIEEDLYIHNCSNLQNTMGLRNISHIGGYLSIYSNPNLKEITDLSKLRNVEGISISENLSLHHIDGFDQLMEIRTSLDIFGTQLQNLNAFQNLTKIGGGLTIFDNPQLTDLNGLLNLNTVGEKIIIGMNDMLVSLDGLANVSSTISRLQISNNPHLQNIEGLHNVKTTEFVTIESNYSLKSLEGLSNIRNLRKLEVYENNSLLNLNGLNNVTNVGDLGVDIHNNNRLSSLNGLDGINQIDGPLKITGNIILRDFCVIQDLLLNRSSGPYDVRDNFYNPTRQNIIDGACSL